MSIPNNSFNWVPKFMEQRAGAYATGPQRSNIGRDFLSSITPLIPFVGSLASGLLQRHWANKDLKAQLEYNSLKGQAAQAREANLPLSALVSGMNAGQSEGQRSTELSADLGAAKGLEMYQMPKARKIEMLLMQSQIDQQKALVEKTWSEASKAQAEAKEAQIRTNWLTELSPTGSGNENFVEMLQYSKKKQEADSVIADLTAQLKQIDVNWSEKEKEAQVNHILASNNRLIQLFNDQQQFLEFKRQVQEDFAKGGTGAEGLLRLLKAALYSWIF